MLLGNEFSSLKIDLFEAKQGEKAPPKNISTLNRKQADVRRHFLCVDRGRV